MGGSTTETQSGGISPEHQVWSPTPLSTHMDGALPPPSFPFGEVEGDGAMTTPVPWNDGELSAPPSAWEEDPPGSDVTGAAPSLAGSVGDDVPGGKKKAMTEGEENGGETEGRGMEAPGYNVQRSNGVFPILGIFLDDQDGSAAEKAILDHTALLALLGTAAAPVAVPLEAFSSPAASPGLVEDPESEGAEADLTGTENGGVPTAKVLGMLGNKGTMLSVLCSHGLGEVDSLAKEWDQKPGIYAFLSTGGSGDICGRPVVLVFFWHPGQKLPLEDSRGSVTTSFVRYIVEMADEVLVCLESGDVEAVSTTMSRDEAADRGKGKGKGRIRQGKRRQPTKGVLQKITEDSVKLHPGFHLKSPDAPKWHNATLSLPTSGSSGIVVQTEATGESKMVKKVERISTPSFPSVFQDMLSNFRVQWERLPPKDVMSLVQYGAPPMWEEIEGDAKKAQHLAQQELSATVLTGGTLSQLQDILRGAALFFLGYTLPAQEQHVLDSGLVQAHPKGPLPYPRVAKQLTRILSMQPLPEQADMTCLQGKCSVSISTAGAQSQPYGWLGIAPQAWGEGAASVAKPVARLTVSQKQEYFYIHCSEVPSYGGPLLLGQRVKLISKDGEVEVVLKTSRYCSSKQHGPAVLGDHFCFVAGDCDGMSRSHRMRVTLSYGGQQPDLWHGWMSHLAAQAPLLVPATSPPAQGNYPPAATRLVLSPDIASAGEYVRARDGFLSLVRQQLETQWVVRMLQDLDDWKKAEDGKIASRRAEEAEQQRAREVLGSLVDDESSTNKPVLEVTLCKPVQNQFWGKGPEFVKLQWNEEDITHGQRHWDMLSLSPEVKDTARANKSPLEAIVPRRISTDRVLVGPEGDVELLQWYLLRDQQPLLFLRNSVDSSVSIFLGKVEVKRLARGADAMAFDEASRTLALFDRAKASIRTHLFNERFTKLDPTPTEIDLAETQSQDVEWMSLARGGQRLVVVAGGRVQLFALDQGGMIGARLIELMQPFAGSACLSPDGRCLFVLSSSAAPTPAPTPASATEPGPADGEAVSHPGVHHSAGAASLATPGLEAPAKATQEEGVQPATSQGPVGSEGAEKKGPEKCEAHGVGSPGPLSLHVYLLEALKFYSSFPLEGITGTPEEWSLGGTVFGMQQSLLLHHRSSGVLHSRVLDISTTEEKFRMQPEAPPAPEEEDGGKRVFAASPAAALEAVYHAFDKFPTSPCLSPATRDLTLRLVLPATEPANPGSGKPGDIPQGVLERHVASLQKKLETESAKDFSHLTLQATVTPSAELSAGSTGVATVGSAPQAHSARQCLGLDQAPVQLSQWADRVMCLVPVQIARAQGNSLHPMKDGLRLPPDAAYTDAVSLSRLLSFGPYDGLLASWHGPVKVVSSMGKQSSGKSYLMNHLSGSLLDISGGRCTDGVWMTVREAGGCLYVLLDFEGLGSVERTEQEDMLLSVFNAAISSLTIFNKRECHMDKDTQEVFARFQAGVDLLAEDSKLFRSYFYLAIKDVPDNDSEAVQDEFMAKLRQMCKKDRDNFLWRMFGGHFTVAPMAHFHHPMYQEDVAAIATLLDEDIEPGYNSGRSFLENLKLLLAQMSTKDWSPMDAKRVTLRVSLIQKELPSALLLGCARGFHPSGSSSAPDGDEAMPGSGKESALTNLETQEPIVADPEAWATFPGFQFEEDTNLPFPSSEDKGGEEGEAPSWESQLKRLLLATPDQGLELPGAGEEGGELDPGRLHRRLREIFEDSFPRSKAWQEKKWHSRLQVFLQALVCRRATRVLGWLDDNCKEFEGEEEVRRLRAECLEALEALRRAARLCSAQCDACFLLCVEPRGHSHSQSPTQPHSCGGTHLCQESCTFCTSDKGAKAPAIAEKSEAGHGAEAEEQGLRCQFKAGHQGHHNCQIRKHLCQQRCGLAEEARNCALVCSREAGHEDEHLCNSTEHRCKSSCSLPTCGNPCILPHQHKGDIHRCHESACPSPCPFPGCPRTCGSQDHLHSLAGECTHLCGHEHACGALCESEGFCELKTEVERRRELFVGRRGLFEFDLETVQEGVRRRCAIVVPPHELIHTGPHCHTTDPNPHHYCNASCPQCEYVCTLPHGHQGLHETGHGSMKKTHFAGEAPDIDILDRKYAWGESGQAEMCGMHCRVQGRGHIHLRHCTQGSGDGCTVAGHVVGARHETKTYGPDHEVPKDEYTHDAFWRILGFKDPCTADERAAFALCNHFCGAAEHVRDAGMFQEPQREKVHCTERLWHAPLSTETVPPGATAGVGTIALNQQQQGMRSALARGGYVSQDGHFFPCAHSSSAPHHVLFVIDKSKSMGKNDVRPQYPKVSAVQNNRLGCVYESMIRFMRLRRQLGGGRDFMSIVLFDDEATTPVKVTRMHEEQVTCALRHRACRGTNFCSALLAAGQLVQHGQTSRAASNALPVIIFLSDGGSGFGDPLATARELKQRFPALTLHTIKFGRDTTHASVLPAMASIGNGRYTESLNEVQLAQTFACLATSLRPNVSALM